MKVCVIDESNFKIYETYIPQNHRGEMHASGRIPVGFYDSERAYGASILYVHNGTAEIIWLAYNGDMEAGICEKAVTDFILAQEWEIFRIVYVVDGELGELLKFDRTMLSMGYAPRDGEVKKYHASVEDIVANQSAFLNKQRKKLSSKEYVQAGILTSHQINEYNARFPDFPFNEQDYDPELSVFALRESKAVGCIYISRNEDDIEFSWMVAKALNMVERMRLIAYFVLNMAKVCKSGTDVVVCPYLSEVEVLVKQFGFELVEDNCATRIYTYYLF